MKVEVAMLQISRKKLDIWKNSIDVVSKINELTKQFPTEEKYGLVLMRRVSVSITSNYY